MHSPSALTEHVSLNLAGFFLLDPVEEEVAEAVAQGDFIKVWSLTGAVNRNDKRVRGFYDLKS